MHVAGQMLPPAWRQLKTHMRSLGVAPRFLCISIELVEPESAPGIQPRRISDAALCRAALHEYPSDLRRRCRRCRPLGAGAASPLEFLSLPSAGTGVVRKGPACASKACRRIFFAGPSCYERSTLCTNYCEHDVYRSWSLANSGARQASRASSSGLTVNIASLCTHATCLMSSSSQQRLAPGRYGTPATPRALGRGRWVWHRSTQRAPCWQATPERPQDGRAFRPRKRSAMGEGDCLMPRGPRR